MKYVPRKIKGNDMDRIKIVFIFSLIILFGIVPAFDQAESQPERGKKTVVIDPGHGGSDHGVKFGDKTFEKEQNLRLALALQKELHQAGFNRIVLTRSTDKDVSYKERSQLIKGSDPQVVIGLHANAGFGSKARGYELYFPGFKSAQETRNDPSAIIGDMTKNKHLNDSVRIAQHIQKHLSEIFPKENRGLREAPLPLLAGVNVPAVIIEIGFLTNKENRQKLADEKGQQEIARAIARGIKEGL